MIFLQIFYIKKTLLPFVEKKETALGA